MSVKDHVVSGVLGVGFGVVAYGGIAAGLPFAVDAVGDVGALVAGSTTATAALLAFDRAAEVSIPEFKRFSMFAGAGLGGVAVGVVIAIGCTPQQSPAMPAANAQATTLTVEGPRNGIRTKFTGKDGDPVQVILPANCHLNPQ